jgi:hypothetical protein
MLIKQYNLWENFVRVYPQFIDTRLSDQWIEIETDKANIANTITHLIIYHDVLSIEEIEQIEVVDALVPIDIEKRTIYAFNNFLNLTYSITKQDIKKIVNKQPLSASIHQILVDYAGYKIKNMGSFTTKTDVWTEIFAK